MAYCTNDLKTPKEFSDSCIIISESTKNFHLKKLDTFKRRPVMVIQVVSVLTILLIL